MGFSNRYQSNRSRPRFREFDPTQVVRNTAGRVVQSVAAPLAKNSFSDWALADQLRTNIGVYVIAIRRENKWIFDPEKSVQMLVGDVLIGIGPKEGCKHLQKLASGGSRTI